MLLERKEFIENGVMTLVESFYDSSNIVKSDYFVETSTLYIFFKNGLVYSYGNISKELYENFESAESQGKFFIAEIRKKPQNYRYLREFKMYEFEKEDVSKIIENLKSSKNVENSNN